MSMIENDDVEPNTVLTVIQKGYILNGRVIRPAGSWFPRLQQLERKLEKQNFNSLFLELSWDRGQYWN